jgi:hypothetical protein
MTTNIDPTRIHVEVHEHRFWEQSQSFEDIMAEQLRHAPWLGLSILLHALIGLILLAMPVASTDRKVPVVIQTQSPVEELPIEEPPPEEEHEIEPEFEPEPVLQDSTVLDPLEELQADRFEDEPEPIDTALDLDAFNDVVGIGGGAGGKFGGRGTGHAGLRRKGGRPTAEAITRALQWLEDHQEPDGCWSSAEFMRQCPIGDVCGGPGSAVNDIGLTGLALLAFLGDGSTMRAGPYQDVVKDATVWLKDQQDDSGLLGTESGRQFMYNHALGALALVESYGLSKYRTLERYAQRAVDYICNARNPYKVWRYYPRDGDNDTSVTGWMVFVLKSAQDFGLTIDADALKYSKAWLDEVTDPSTGQCGYQRRGEGSARAIGLEQRFPASKTEAMTAVGLLCRIFLGQTPQDTPVLRVAADTMLKRLPTWNEADGSIDLYYWYYGSYAMFQMGGHWWSRWRASLEKALLRTQRRDGHRKGSWDPIDPWSDDGGRVYATALGVLCLEVYYRYTRLIR